MRKFMLALVALAIGAGAARAGDTGPKEWLEKIYRTYIGHDAKGVEWNKHIPEYFDAELTRLFAKDREDAKGEVGRLDAEPLMGAQDWEVTAVKVDVAAKDDTHATGTVTLTDLGKPRTITLELAKGKAGWRIHDVHWSGQKDGLLKILTP